MLWQVRGTKSQTSQVLLTVVNNWVQQIPGERHGDLSCLSTTELLGCQVLPISVLHGSCWSPIKKCNDTFPIKDQHLLLENPTCNKCNTRFLKQTKASIGHCTVYPAITFNSFINVISFLRKGFYNGDKILSIFNWWLYCCLNHE